MKVHSARRRSGRHSRRHRVSVAVLLCVLAAVLLPVGHSADAVSLQETAPDLVTPELRANPMFTFVDCADRFWDQVCGNGNDDLSPNLPAIPLERTVVIDGPISCWWIADDGQFVPMGPEPAPAGFFFFVCSTT